MKINRYKKKILEIILNRLNPANCIIFLFGSYVDGSYNRGSDIDIGIISNEKISDVDFLEIKESLNSEFLIEIDLVNLNEISEEIRKQILKEEIKIWHIGKKCKELLKNLKMHIKN